MGFPQSKKDHLPLNPAVNPLSKLACLHAQSLQSQQTQPPDISRRLPIRGTEKVKKFRRHTNLYLSQLWLRRYRPLEVQTQVYKHSCRVVCSFEILHSDNSDIIFTFTYDMPPLERPGPRTSVFFVDMCVCVCMHAFECVLTKARKRQREADTNPPPLRPERS